MAGSGETCTIVYVEDTESNVHLVARILAMRPGVRLITAPTGQAGIDLVRSERPVLVLLDMHLPDIDGLDVLHRLKSDPATAPIPVAGLSADATRQRMEAVIAAGAVAYITKPITVHDFLTRIDALLATAT